MTTKQPVDESSKADIASKLQAIEKAFGIACKHKNVRKFALLNGMKKLYCKDCSVIVSGTVRPYVASKKKLTTKERSVHAIKD